MGNCVGVVSGDKVEILKSLAVGNVLFGFFGDYRHCLDRPDGIFSCGGFARQHYRTAVVVYGVCHVGYFRSGRTGIVYHRFEHLGRRDYTLAGEAAFFDEVLLNVRHFLERNFNAEVAPRNHNALAGLADFADIVNARTVFNLCDKLDVFAADFFQIILDIEQILLPRNERGGNEVNAVLHAEKNVGFVLLA